MGIGEMGTATTLPRAAPPASLAQIFATAADWQGTEERLAARAMMGRIGEPEDIANAVVFLVSPESGWITAQMLRVDGGRMDYIGHG
jgi:NAD(P)-dependent dehydrogenase (short-subunit alcohol dehydrogenase family)